MKNAKTLNGHQNRIDSLMAELKDGTIGVDEFCLGIATLDSPASNGLLLRFLRAQSRANSLFSWIM
jgi:hypothetical protein